MRQTSRPARTGSALIIVIVLLTVTMAGLGTMLKMQLLQQKQLQHREWQLQAQLLLNSAYERAVHRLQQNPDYFGEEWQVSLDGQPADKGHSQIRVTPQESSGDFEISIQVRVPDHPQHRVQLSAVRVVKSLVFELNP